MARIKHSFLKQATEDIGTNTTENYFDAIVICHMVVISPKQTLKKPWPFEGMLSRPFQL